MAAAGALVKQFVRFSATHPELNRLMMQDCMQASWRAEHECIGLFGGNPRDPAFVEGHADMVVRMLLPAGEN